MFFFNYVFVVSFISPTLYEIFIRLLKIFVKLKAPNSISKKTHRKNGMSELKVMQTKAEENTSTN